jgi:hypothetical protein
MIEMTDRSVEEAIVNLLIEIPAEEVNIHQPIATEGKNQSMEKRY